MHGNKKKRLLYVRECVEHDTTRHFCQTVKLRYLTLTEALFVALIRRVQRVSLNTAGWDIFAKSQDSNCVLYKQSVTAF